MSNKEKVYLLFSIIFVSVSIGIIAWIDRQEMDRKISEKAEMLCAQNNQTKQGDGVGSLDMSSVNDQSRDSKNQIKNKSDADDSLVAVDSLMKSVEDDDGYMQ